MRSEASKPARSLSWLKHRRAKHYRPLIERLESRLALATVFGVTDADVLVRFDSATPGTINAATPITGLVGGETIQGIDFRPATGQLYGMTNQSRIYTINVSTGAATLASTASVALTGTAFGVDFNPVPDRLRIVSDADQNLRVNVDSGAATIDLALAYDVGDANAAADPNVVDTGYTNSFAGATTTTLFGIDTELDILVIQNPPNNGTLNTVGALGIDVTNVGGFDIEALPGLTNAAFAALSTNGTSSGFYTIDLTTGAAALVGSVGTAPTLLSGIAVVPEAAPNANLIGVDEINNLIRFNSGTPEIIQSSIPITGLVGDDKLSGIDFRPATGVLYGINNSGSRLYTINTMTGVATQVGTDGGFFLGASAGDFGFDFDPTSDLIRVTSAPTNLNVRLNPDDGTLASTDSSLAWAPFDPGADEEPRIFGLAHTNNFSGATTTTLYGLDPNQRILATIPSPNDGILHTVGIVGVSINPQMGFDVRSLPSGEQAFFSTNDSNELLYSLNLATGATVLLGVIGTPGSDIEVLGLAVIPTGSFEFSAPTYSVGEGGPVATITVNRVGGSEGIATVQVDSTNGTATAPADYTDSDQVLVFGSGVTSQQFTIPIVNDTHDEPAETFNLALNNPSGGAVLGGRFTATVTIIDDDEPPPGLPDCDITTLNLPANPGTAILRDDADNPGTGVLIVTGTSGNDVIIIEPRPSNSSQIRVKRNGQQIGIFNRSEVQHIVVFGLTGDDTIIVNATLSQRATLFGHRGNDQLFGARGADGLDGGIGNDWLFGGSGNDTICGGGGNDFIYGQAGNDFLGGEAGQDQIFGEAGCDFLLGSDGNDLLFGGTGNDRLFGEAGNDLLFGESDNDIVVGGHGDDLLFGAGGLDLLIGGRGGDTLFGDAHDDILVAGFTVHDNNEADLRAILAEWTSTRSYNTRKNNIRNGTGTNGSFVLDDTTVFDDGTRDTLFGGAGRDWFWIGTNDKIKDRMSSEQVN